MIIIEQFDPNKYTLEKVGTLVIWQNVINVSNGYLISDIFDDQNLPESALWSDKSLEKLRIQYWQEINKYLPSFQKYLKTKYEKGFDFNPPNQEFFSYLVKVTLIYKKHGTLKLLYLSDMNKAELIKRVILWLSTQF